MELEECIKLRGDYRCNDDGLFSLVRRMSTDVINETLCRSRYQSEPHSSSGYTQTACIRILNRAGKPLFFKFLF